MNARILATLLALGLAACQDDAKDGRDAPGDADDSDPTGVVVDSDDTVDTVDTDPLPGDTDTDVAIDTDTDTDLVDTGDTGTPIPQDTAAPMLVIHEPPHGAWLPSGPVDLIGTVTDPSPFVLSVDGDVVTPDASGDFQVPLEAGYGIRIMETRAEDASGNIATDARAVMIGDERPAGDLLADAILARLDEGDGGIDTIEQLAQGFVDPSMLAGMIPNPVISQSSQSCIDLGWFGTQCITWYSLDFYVNDVTFGAFTVDLDPKAAGNLIATVTVNDLDVAWSADATAAGIPISMSGDMTAAAIVVTLDVTVTVDPAGNLVVTVNGSSVAFQDFQAGLPSTLTDVAGFFGVDIDQMILDQIQAQLDGVLRDQVPALLADALGSLAVPVSIDVAGATLDLLLKPTSIAVDETGLTLGLGLAVTATPDTAPDTGSLYVGFHPPSFPGIVGTRVAISLDGVNQLLRGAWGAGIAQIGTLLGGGGPIDMSLLIPGATDATIGVASPLPPVMIPHDATQAELQVGDLDLRVDSASSGHLLDAWTSIRADVGVSIVDGNLSLAATPVQVAIDIDGGFARHQDALESTFEALALQLLPALTQTVGAFPVPTIAGFGLTDTSIVFDGPEHGYMLISGKLAAAPVP